MVNKQSLIFLFSLSMLAGNVNAYSPCEEISGPWQGIVYTYKCQWEVKAFGAYYKDDFQLRMTSLKGTPSEYCKTGTTVTYTGICKNGKLEITYDNATAKGSVFGGLMEFGNSYMKFSLQKQSA